MDDRKAVAGGRQAGQPAAALAAQGVSKTYPGTKALSDAFLDVAPGEVRALAGGNGSGKSTLIRILAGVVEPDPGTATFSVFGQLSAGHLTPARAHDVGLRFVHQDPATFDNLTLAENLAVGSRFETARAGRISRKRLNRWAQGILDHFQIEAPPSTELGRLSPSAKTMIAIARAVGNDLEDGRVLILDEATASLTDPECASVFEVVRRVAALGHAVIFVTHRLEEVLTESQSVTILRNGRVVETRPTEGLTEQQLIASMLGRSLSSTAVHRPAGGIEDAILKVTGLAAGPLRKMDFELRSGEVLGVAGLLGSGRTTLLRTLFGEVHPAAGQMEFQGRAYSPRSPREAMQAGVSYVPENRLDDAAFLNMPVSANLSAAAPREFYSGARFARKAERAANLQLIERYSIKIPSLSAPMAQLSGGNQQKVILARCMRRSPKLLLLDEPTQGVDVGARADIHDYIRAAVSAQASAVFVSSDFEELVLVCDRVLVIRDGEVANVVARGSLTSELLEELSHSSTARKADGRVQN